MSDSGLTGNEMGRVEGAARAYSRPSDLKITDLRVARVAAPYDYILIRIDTNQGVYGIGEGHESSHVENVLQYKSLLLGQNPCNVDMIFKAIKIYGSQRTEGGGVSGIEMALWDLVGRVYGVPCYQFLGGKYRDSVRLYADTPPPDEPTPEGYAARVLGRKELGLTLIKFDLGLHVLRGICRERPDRQAAPRDDYAPGAPGRAGARQLWHGALRRGPGAHARDRGRRARAGRLGRPPGPGPLWPADGQGRHPPGPRPGGAWASPGWRTSCRCGTWRATGWSPRRSTCPP